MNPTGTEARVCADIATRQAKGTAKYGTTVQDNPLGLIQWLQHAYEECLDQAVYLKRAMELLQGVESESGISTKAIQKAFIKQAMRRMEEAGDLKPSNSAELELGQGDAQIRKVADELKDPHAELRKTWREGQVWQGSPNPKMYGEGLGWNTYDAGAVPGWYADWIYRRHPEDKDTEPAPPADPHAALKAIYQPGMRWRHRNAGRTDHPWYHWRSDDTPYWDSASDYEIHPDDLPKEPTDDGWITVPDDCMEMPAGLKREDQIVVRFRSGEVDLHATQAGSWHWKMRKNDASRIVAYRIIKPAE